MVVQGFPVFLGARHPRPVSDQTLGPPLIVWGLASLSLCFLSQVHSGSVGTKRVEFYRPSPCWCYQDKQTPSESSML